jgi:hypothetical protein
LQNHEDAKLRSYEVENHFLLFSSSKALIFVFFRNFLTSNLRNFILKLMNIILTTEGIDLQDCDVLVTGFFQDEKPLQGTSGWIDWRLNGLLSRFLIDRRMTGIWKETVLIPSQGRIVPRLILLVGLGKVREYSSLRVRELSPYLLSTLKKLGISSLCISFPYGEAYRVECAKLIEVLIEGMSDGMDQNEWQIDGSWVENLRIHFAEGEERFPEVLMGVQTAKGILAPQMDIRILIPTSDEIDGIHREGVVSPKR